MDLFGFNAQLVFPSYSAGPAFDVRRPIEDRFTATRAYNRAMADFCSRDARLHGVALLPLEDPRLALEELDHIVSLGLKAVWISHRPPGDLWIGLPFYFCALLQAVGAALAITHFRRQRAFAPAAVA